MSDSQGEKYNPHSFIRFHEASFVCAEFLISFHCQGEPYLLAVRFSRVSLRPLRSIQDAGSGSDLNAIRALGFLSSFHTSALGANRQAKWARMLLLFTKMRLAHAGFVRKWTKATTAVSFEIL